MALRSAPELILDYDQEGDVLYASLGPPQHAVTDEVDEDILLRYCPPSGDVVGITIVNFRRHFPREDAADVIQHLLRQYPVVPWFCDGQQ
jgi:uncharacterized protein YuzE